MDRWFDLAAADADGSYTHQGASKGELGRLGQDEVSPLTSVLRRKLPLKPLALEAEPR